MTSLPDVSASIVLPIMLSIYALAFLAGGIYYLEQQVARIRDLFPRQGPCPAGSGIDRLHLIEVPGFSISQVPILQRQGGVHL